VSVEVGPTKGKGRRKPLFGEKTLGSGRKGGIDLKGQGELS